MRCEATRRDGGKCQQFPRRGGTRCNLHGGAAPQTLAAAKARQETERASRTAHRHGITPVTDPLGELLNLAGEVRAVKDVLAAKVDQGGSAALAYERSLDRVHRVLADIARLNIEERVVRLQQSQVAGLVDSVMQFADLLVEGLGREPDEPEVRRVVADAMREMERRVSGGQSIPRGTGGYRPAPRVIEP